MAKPEPVDPARIMEKWKRRTAGENGCFLRYLDGDIDNCEPSNLEAVHPFDAFSAMYHARGWTVDWHVDLTEAEQVSHGRVPVFGWGSDAHTAALRAVSQAFVRAHAWNFCVTYQADGRDPVEPPIDREHIPGSGDQSVAELTAQGDAAMEAGDYDTAVELYEAAKERRDGAAGEGATLAAARFEHLGERENVSAGSASTLELGEMSKSLPKHGRRASGHSLSQLATPSRRAQPDGAPSRKEEVAARVAARYQ